MSESYFYKHNPTDQIWWYHDPNTKGFMRFTFDKKQIFYLFRDYPWGLTKEQKEIFDRENPYWADYFSNRTTEKK